MVRVNVPTDQIEARQQWLLDLAAQRKDQQKRKQREKNVGNSMGMSIDTLSSSQNNTSTNLQETRTNQKPKNLIYENDATSFFNGGGGDNASKIRGGGGSPLKNVNGKVIMSRNFHNVEVPDETSSKQIEEEEESIQNLLITRRLRTNSSKRKQLAYQQELKAQIELKKLIDNQGISQTRINQNSTCGVEFNQKEANVKMKRDPNQMSTGMQNFTEIELQKQRYQQELQLQIEENRRLKNKRELEELHELEQCVQGEQKNPVKESKCEKQHYQQELRLQIEENKQLKNKRESEELKELEHCEKEKQKNPVKESKRESTKSMIPLLKQRKQIPTFVDIKPFHLNRQEIGLKKPLSLPRISEPGKKVMVVKKERLPEIKRELRIFPRGKLASGKVKSPYRMVAIVKPLKREKDEVDKNQFARQLKEFSEFLVCESQRYQ